MLINDRRDPSVVVTHTASNGQVVSSATEPRLLLLEGSIQQFFPETRTLSTIQFDSLNYDLSQFVKDVGARVIRAEETFTWQLPRLERPDAGMEVHDRFVKSLLAIVVPILGAIVLLSAGFSRSGFFLRIALGVVFMVAINAARGMVQGVVEDGLLGWPILYAPVVVAFLAIVMMIRVGQAPWKSGLRGLINPNGAAT